VLQLYKEAGGLQILAELITDKTSSLADEAKGQDKEEKGKKGKATKAEGGKKSRVGDGGSILESFWRLLLLHC